MKSLTCLLSVILLMYVFFLTPPGIKANWIKNNTNIETKSNETFQKNISGTEKSDPLPEGVTDDWLNGLEDENGNKIIRDHSDQPDHQNDDPEGDAFRRKIYEGTEASALLGYSVSGAGDVNGDGYDDVIIGAHGSSSFTGKAYLYFGGAVINTIPDKIFTGEASSNLFGKSVSKAGDVNGDGYDDVIIGAEGYNSVTGRAYVYYGGTSMNTISDVTMTGEGSGHLFGSTVTDAGDVNGDGYADVFVGADGYNSNTGRAYIFYGGSAMNNTADVIMTGLAVGDLFGHSVSSAGDVNGDGYADVIAGANGYSAFTGRAYIFYGGSAMNNTADVIFTGEFTDSFLGYSVSGAGDVNGDGYSDVIVGAYRYSFLKGRTYIYYGGPVMDNTADVIMNGENSYDRFGHCVSDAGDINGDGFDDVVVGANSFQTDNNRGKIYVYFGGITMDNSPDAQVEGENVNNRFGFSVSAAGDLNGDGYANIIAGAYEFNSGYGRAYLYDYFMNNEIVHDLIMKGDAANDQFGYSVSSAGDVNGDGYDDVIVGAGGYSSNTGRVYIYFGGIVINKTADVVMTGEGAGDFFGNSVSSAGDVNGDGFDDVIVGALNNDAGGVNAGRTYIYFGGASMNNVADVILTGEAVGDNFGKSVSSAGDVNGDGYGDVVVGASSYSSLDVGRAYVYLGGSPMNNTVDVFLNGEASYDSYGWSVSSAGDVNGDGYADVIVGAIGNNAGGSNAGRAYVYFGGTSMNNSADVFLTGESEDDYFGWSVSLAGDVNGDGYADVIVGANLNDAGGTAAGRAYVYFGGAPMNNTADVVFTGEAVLDDFGGSVSKAGDVNDDGFDDVIVGASGNDGGGTNAGRAYVYFGGAVMNNTADVIMTGEAVGGGFGGSVFTAGDLNGDGYDDLIVGADNNDDAGMNAGAAYMFLGSAISVKPILISAKDVPDDQGGYIKLKWARSSFDVIGIENITGYKVERSVPPGTSGFEWEYIETVPAALYPFYYYTAQTPTDSGVSGNHTFFFRVTAQTNVISQNWKSNIISGYSIDNLSPEAPQNLMASSSSGSVMLSWDQNTEPDLHHYNIYRNGSELSTSLTPDFNDSTVMNDSAYNYNIAAVDVHGNISQLSNTAMVSGNLSGTINLSLIIQGFYNTSSGEMNSSDSVTVYLGNSSAPYAVVDSAKNVIDASTFSGSFEIQNAPAGNYYIITRHRNSIETWSALPVSYSPGGIINFDFTTSLSQAYGSNQLQVDASPVKFAVFGGDVNQDGTVDVSDVSTIDNDIFNFISGYVVTDLNGDEVVDLADIAIADNNSFNFVSAVVP